MRHKYLIAAAIVAAFVAIPATASADPDFGPGNSSKGPNEQLRKGRGRCEFPETRLVAGLSPFGDLFAPSEAFLVFLSP